MAPPDPVDVITTLEATLDDLGEMLTAHFGDDEIRRVLALIAILDHGMEWLRTEWARQYQQRHGVQ